MNPVMTKDVPKFEHQNYISINVYILQKKKERFTVAPTHITGQKRDRHVNLFLIQNYYPDEEEPELPVENDDGVPLCLPLCLDQRSVAPCERAAIKP